MGNTPSQGGFHHPEDQLRNQSQSQGQNTDPIPPDNQDSAPADTRRLLPPSDTFHSLPMGVNLNNKQKDTLLDNSQGSDASDFRTHVGDQSVNNILSDQCEIEPYSMDSLALDTTSSIATGEFSPSSLSPDPQKSEDPLGRLITSKSASANHKESSRYQVLESISPSVEMDSIQFNDEMLNNNEFDSLDEPSNSLNRDDNISQHSISTSSSGFGPFQKANEDEVDEDIVTVNGLQVQPTYAGTMDCSGLERDESSETICKSPNSFVEDDGTPKEKPVDESHAESQVNNNISPSSSGFISEADSPCTMNKICVPEEDEKDIMALDEPMHANLVHDLCSAPVLAKCEMHQVQQSDFHTKDLLQEVEEKDAIVNNLANPTVNKPANARNVSVIEINSETKCTSKQQGVSSVDESNDTIAKNKFMNSSCEKGFGFGRKTLMFLPKANPVPETSSASNSHYDDDEHAEMTEDEYPSLCEIDIDSQEDSSEVGDERVVISNLLFIEGQNEVDGGLYTQVFLKSTENSLGDKGSEPMYTKAVPRLDQNMVSSDLNVDSKNVNKSHPKPPRKNLPPPPPPPIVTENVSQRDNNSMTKIGNESNPDKDESSSKEQSSENYSSNDCKTRNAEPDLITPDSKINFARNAKKIRKNMLNWESLDEFEKLEADLSNSDTNDRDDNKIPIKRPDPSKKNVKTLFEDPNTGFNYGNVAFVDEIFVRKGKGENILCTSRCNTLERQVYSSQDREMQEESIDFHKQAFDLNDTQRGYNSNSYTKRTKLSTINDIRTRDINTDSPCVEEEYVYNPNVPNFAIIEAKPSEALQKLQESAQKNSRLLSDPSYLQKMNRKMNEQSRKELLLSTSSTRANLLIFNDDCTSTITTAIHADSIPNPTSKEHNDCNSNYGTMLEMDMKPSATQESQPKSQSQLYNLKNNAPVNALMTVNEIANANDSNANLPKSDVEGLLNKISDKVDPYMDLASDPVHVFIPVPPPLPPALLKQEQPTQMNSDTEDDLRQNIQDNNHFDNKSLEEETILPPEGFCNENDEVNVVKASPYSSPLSKEKFEKADKVQHISKVYVSNDLPDVFEPELQTRNSKFDFSCDQQGLHFGRSKHHILETVIHDRIVQPEKNTSNAQEENKSYIEIDGFEKTSSKRTAKPPRLTSNYRNPAFNNNNKSKELQKEDFPSVEIFDGSTRRTSESSIGESDNKLCEPKSVGEFLGGNQPFKYETSSVLESNYTDVATNRINTSGDNNSKFGDFKSVNHNISSQLNKLDLVIEEGEETETEVESNQNTPRESESNSETTIGPGKFSEEMNSTRVNLKRQSSFGTNSSESASISSNECSLVFLPKNTSTPSSTSEAIFQELRRKQAARFHENGVQNNFYPPVSSTENDNFSMMQRTSSKTKNSKMSFSMNQRNEEINFQGFEKERNIPFGEHLQNQEVPFGGVGAKSVLRKTSSLGLGEQGSQVCKNNLTGVRGKIMSPSLSNNFMEMNGIDNHTDNEDNFISAQEETFSKQLQEKENYINELQNNLESMKIKASSEPSYTKVLAEYEKTLSMYIQKVDEMKGKLDASESEKRELIRERDQAFEDLRNVESAFSDVHRKYERSKGLLENLKANEDTLIRRDQELIQKILIRDKKIDALKDKAQENLEQMHLDYENRIRDLEGENTRLRAQFRKMEMKLDSLENDVEQKAKENAQLSALCDELINGQGVN